MSRFSSTALSILNLGPNSGLISGVALASALTLAACGDNILIPVDASPLPVDPPVQPDARTQISVPLTYLFESQFQQDVSSVVFDEASLLRVLALELDLQVARLTELIDSGELTPADGEVLTALERYYDFDLALDGRTSLLLVTGPPPVQPSLDSIASGLDRGLADRIAGSDPAGMHRDFTQAFAGWQEDGVTSPDTLVRSWLGRIDELAVQRAAGPVPQGPDGKPIAEVYITPQGHDLRQLVSSFLVGAVSFSRAVDVHLDDDTTDLGIAASNAQYGELPYSLAENHWDLAFGHFGAAYDFSAYTDEEAAGLGGREGWSAGHHDSTGSGGVDLRFEHNYGSARLAAAADVADPDADRTGALFTAFLTGRAILQASGQPLSTERRQAMLEQRDAIAKAWEALLGETAVRALDQTLASMDAFGTAGYDFAAHARAWSTLEGMALGLQFSRFSPLSDDDRAALYQHIGDAPVLPDAGAGAIAAYRTALASARAILVAAYAPPAGN
jgi:hypothetical protein